MRVNFKPTRTRKEKKKKRITQLRTLNEEAKKELESEMAGESVDKKMENLGLTKPKRKQIFKKNKARDLKAMIKDLKIQSKKFKKKDHTQKPEKKKIAK